MDTQSTSSTSLHFSSTSNFSSSSNIREKLTILEKTIGIGDPPPPGGGYFGVDSTSLGTFESSQLQVGKSLLRSCQSGGGVTNSSVQQQLLFKRRFYSQDLERIQPDGCQIGECEETGELRRQQQKLYSSLVNKVGHMLCEGGLVSSIKQSEGGFRGGGGKIVHILFRVIREYSLVKNCRPKPRLACSNSPIDAILSRNSGKDHFFDTVI